MILSFEIIIVGISLILSSFLLAVTIRASVKGGPRAVLYLGAAFGVILLNNSIYPALFWWNNTYNLNGNNETLISPYGNMLQDMFESGQINFEFNLSGSSSMIFQDPYLATAGIGITTLPPSTITLAAINFLLEHAELLAGGAAIGSVLIAIPYFAYRRKKLV